VPAPIGDRRDSIHRSAVAAALRKAAALHRLDPRGDPDGAAAQALEDYFRRAEQIVAGGDDVSGWISTVTERRWINELRYQRRRAYERLDAPAGPHTPRTLGDVTAARTPAVEDIIEARERLRGIASEQTAALAFLKRKGIQRRHLRIVELALAADLMHHEIAATVNAEFPLTKPIQGNTVTQIVCRQRDRLAEAGRFPTVVVRMRKIRRAA
jgi:DNA-directed RNA polymerase specialized sigma24 family protein